MKYIHKIYLITTLSVVSIIIGVITYNIFKKDDKIEEVKQESTKALDISYVKSEQFLKDILSRKGDINSPEAANSTLTGSVKVDPISSDSLQFRNDSQLTTSQLSQKYTYPELLAKFGEDRVNLMYPPYKIQEFKDIPDKHNFPKTKFMIKHDTDENLCLDDGGTQQPGQYKMNFSECNESNSNQHFIYEPYRKYIKSATKNLCLDNGDNDLDYNELNTTSKIYNFSMQICNPDTFRQRFFYENEQKMIQNNDRRRWALTNPSISDKFVKNIAYNRESNNNNYSKQRMIFKTL